LFVLLALVAQGDKATGYIPLAAAAGMAVSAVHGSIKRSVLSGLATLKGGKLTVLKGPTLDFLLHGAKYAFPPIWGPLDWGLPTGYAASPLKEIIEASADPVPVWPHAEGSVRGMILAPLFPTVPKAALANEKLYALLALFDAVRAGRARERNAAAEILGGLLK